MTELIASLSTGKGTWGTVARLIKGTEWESVFLITNSFGKENFTADEKTHFIEINNLDDVSVMSKKIFEGLKDKVKGTEVALNLTSGSGNEHMAILSALLKSGLGIRLVTFKDKVEVL